MRAKDGKRGLSERSPADSGGKDTFRPESAGLGYLTVWWGQREARHCGRKGE